MSLIRDIVNFFDESDETIQDVDPRQAFEERRARHAGYLLLLFVYALFGLWGTLWIADDFDVAEEILVLFVGIPVLTALIFYFWQYPKVYFRWMKARVTGFAFVFFCFTFGIVSLVNATVGTQTITAIDVKKDERLLKMSRKRGSLGLLYEYRF